MLAHFVVAGAQEVGRVDAGDFDRVLEGEEEALARSFFWVEVEQVKDGERFGMGVMCILL